MNGITMAVGQHLDFDVSRIDDALFQKDLRLAKSLAGLRDYAIIIAEQLLLVVTTADTATAAAIGRLQHYPITDFFCQYQCFIHIGQIAIAARYARDTGGNHGVARLDLVTHLSYHSGLGADKTDATPRTDFGQFRIFGKETIARMQGIAPGGYRQVNDVVCIQISDDRV